MIRWARRRYNRDVFLVAKKVFGSCFIDQRTSLQIKAILLRFSGDKDAGKRPLGGDVLPRRGAFLPHPGKMSKKVWIN